MRDLFVCSVPSGLCGAQPMADCRHWQRQPRAWFLLLQSSAGQQCPMLDGCGVGASLAGLWQAFSGMAAHTRRVVVWWVRDELAPRAFPMGLPCKHGIKLASADVGVACLGVRDLTSSHIAWGGDLVLGV